MDQARIDKVTKLLQKAERAGTEAEAEAFYTKAQDLMTRWAIDEAMLQAAGKASTDEIVREHLIIKRSGYFHSHVQLVSGIADANGVRVLVYGPKFGSYAGVDLIGWKSDIERVQMLFTSLLIQLTRERGRQLPEEYRLAGGKYIARWRLSFSLAYATRMRQRLTEQADRSRKQAAKEDTTGTLLPAVQTRDERVQAFYDGIPKSKGRSTTRTVDAKAWSAGTAAADRADIGNTRVGGSRTAIR